VTDVDVLVAGAGGAGVSAAIAAAQAGASVAVIERNRNFASQCNTALSTAMVPAAGSRWQAELGIADSAQMFLADIDHKTKQQANPVVARTLVSVAPELVAWMADDCSVPLTLVTDFVYPGHSVARCHAVQDRSGKTMLEHLLAALRATEATVLTPAELTGLEPLGESWSCTVAAPDATTQTIEAGSVVLATNGYGARQDLVARYLPAMSGALYFGSPGSIGTALDLGAGLGADTACLDAYQGHGSVAVPQGVLTTWATVMHGGVLVNRDGRRFGDETTGYSEYAELVLDQPGGDAWVIIDSAIDQQCRPFADYQSLLAEKAVRWADSLDALAEQTGISSAGLAETLAALPPNSHGADPFGRSAFDHELTPPLAAIRVTGALFHTQGGLQITDHAEVTRDGRPIAGLYAAGGAAVGMSGHGAGGYLAGNGLLAALGLGLIAGRSAAARAATLGGAR
jgi:fumarate reductase flavoprotein subunit